jgi:hypothetical protein
LRGHDGYAESNGVGVMLTQEVVHRRSVIADSVSVIASGGKRYQPKVLREASVLPVAFLGWSRVVGGGYGVVGSVRGVRGNVGGCCGMTGRAGGGAGCSLIGVAGSGVGGKCGGARLAHSDLTTHPGTPCFDRFPRSVVFRITLLEVWEYVLGAVGGPEYQ